MSNPTEANPSLGPLLPLYDTTTGQTNIAWDADPTTVSTDADNVLHGKAAISGTFSSTPPASVVSSVNSSTALLLANATFTGTSESALAYGSISVEAYSDQASAANGLIVEQSQDGTNWDTQASYSVSAATGFQQTINLVAQNFRVVYTNGTVNQAAFRLQVIKMPYPASSATTNQRVNAHSGDFVAGSIVDLATVATDMAELLTDTDNLATIATNTNKIPASPAQEGGNLATIATGMAELLTDTDNLANIPAKGSAAMAGSTPITIATNDTNFTELLTDTDNLANIPAKGTATMTGSTPVTIATNDTVLSELLSDTDNLATIQTNTANIPAKGAAATSASTPVNIASDQTVPGKRTAVAVYSLASAAQTASGNSGDLAVGPYTEIGIDLTTTAQSGVGETIQFFWERKGADGIYYVIWQSVVYTTAANTYSTSIGAGMNYVASLGLTGRFRWVLGGSGSPSYTFSVNVYGK